MDEKPASGGLSVETVNQWIKTFDTQGTNSPNERLAPRRPDRSGLAHKFVTALDLIRMESSRWMIRPGAVGIWDVDGATVWFRPTDVIPVGGATRVGFPEYTILYDDNLARWKFEPAF